MAARAPAAPISVPAILFCAPALPDARHGSHMFLALVQSSLLCAADKAAGRCRDVFVALRQSPSTALRLTAALRPASVAGSPRPLTPPPFPLQADAFLIALLMLLLTTPDTSGFVDPD